MLFKKYQSVPANTTSAVPNWQKLDIAKGEIVQWVIFFDPEAANLLNIRIVYHGSQIMPFSKDQWLTAVFSSAPIGESLLINNPPYVLDIYAYNSSTVNAHEYYIHAIMKAEKPVTVTGEEENLWEKLKGFMGAD